MNDALYWWVRRLLERQILTCPFPLDRDRLIESVVGVQMGTPEWRNLLRMSCDVTTSFSFGPLGDESEGAFSLTYKFDVPLAPMQRAFVIPPPIRDDPQFIKWEHELRYIAHSLQMDRFLLHEIFGVLSRRPQFEHYWPNLMKVVPEEKLAGMLVRGPKTTKAANMVFDGMGAALDRLDRKIATCLLLPDNVPDVAYHFPVG